MGRLLLSLGAVAGLTLSATAQPAPGGAIMRSALHDFKIVPVVEGLVQPWSIAFLPGGDLLITERPGRLRIVRKGTLLPTPVAGVPEVAYENQGGLLEVALHPNFAANRFVYLTYAKRRPDGTGNTTALVRATFEKDALTGVTQLFESVSTGRGHFGGKIAFDGKGHLFLTLGDRQVPPAGDLEAHPAQDLSNHHGTVVRLNDDGTVPANNPFVGKAGVKPEIWSYGHRNVQGIAIDPATGNVWTNEHGPQGGDELNLDRAGKNYGWPVIGFGVNYTTGTAIHSGTHREGMEQPLHVWVPSIGISGATFYTGDRFPQWKGQLFIGGLAGEQIGRVTVAGEKVLSRETLLPGVGRIRDIRQGPDGYLYLVTEDRDGKPTPVVRLEPVERGTTR
ncbi:MAG: PQQ-dependent sugar dehydrogenase [Acidobacteria bacterium]|nr:PQQ-dependent sugar dehydrogenase [Acidobacteriota bacterium]